MKNETVIHSNGCAGNIETIDFLIELLNTLTIDEIHFESYSNVIYTNDSCISEKDNFCPIYSHEGWTSFSGGFEERAHIFRIYTKDKKLIDRLSAAIKNNAGWKKYYEKNLVKAA